MHEFVIGFFNFLKGFWQFMKVVFVFCIIMLVCYWIQNLINAEWGWLGFIKPFLDWLLFIANKIYSISFDIFGTVFELKYLSAVIILTGLAFIMNGLILLTNILEGVYRSAHFVCKKTEEAIFNKELKDDIEKEQKKISKYVLTIHTALKKKFSHPGMNINIDEQNKIMNAFITEKTDKKPMIYDGGFMYQFENFSKIDEVLDVMFKLMHSNSPLDYAICIQAGDDLQQLHKLVELKNLGKVTIAADTAYRYKFNTTHRYQTAQVGLFQYGDRTLEVHEFKEIL